MSAYVVGEVTITDGSWLEEYGAQIAPILEKHGGTYLARGPAVAKLEGDRALPTACVILEFPSAHQAQAWYDDADYGPLIKLRQLGSSTEMVLLDGL